MKAFGAVGKLDAAEALRIAREMADGTGFEFVLMNADLVFGWAHIASAYEHARRAFEAGRNSSKTLGTETLLYASGERQISRAIEKIGVRDGQTRTAIVVIGNAGAEEGGELLSALDLKRDDGVLDAHGKDPGAFGISRTELETVPK